jgi:hypothetical protein
MILSGKRPGNAVQTLDYAYRPQAFSRKMKFVFTSRKFVIWHLLSRISGIQ